MMNISLEMIDEKLKYILSASLHECLQATEVYKTLRESLGRK